MRIALVLLATLSMFTAAVAASPTDVSRELSLRAKVTKAQPSVTRATDCVVDAVSRDPRLEEAVKQIGVVPVLRKIPACLLPISMGKDTQRNEQTSLFANLVANAVTGKCLASVRAMVEACDEYFEEGLGGEFLEGPYLDYLPAKVFRQIEEKAGP